MSIRNGCSRALLALGIVQAIHLGAQPGTLDPSFNPGTGPSTTVLRVHVQDDGKVVAIGGFTSFSGVPAGRIVRLNTDGSLDPTFQTGTGFDDTPFVLAAQSDGKMILSGYFTTFNGAAISSRLIRLNTDGSLDAGFTPPAFTGTLINAIAVLPDDRIVAGLDFFASQKVVRLLADGSPDPTFSTLGSINNAVSRLAVLPDERVLISGQFTSVGGQPRAGLALLQANGALDASFNPGTGATAPPGPSPIQCVAALPSGDLLIGGAFTSYNGNAANSIARLLPDGSMNPSFNTGTGPNGNVLNLVPAADGKVWCMGLFSQFNGDAVPFLCRLESTGARDSGFSAASGANGTVTHVQPVAGGALYVAGAFTHYGAVARSRIARVFDCTPTAWYLDQDEDGFGDPATVVMACEAPEGHVEEGNDCDDTNPDINDANAWYIDADGDGLGDPAVWVIACEGPPGWVEIDTDCDDGDSEVGAATIWYQDFDEDGFGHTEVTVFSCTQPEGYLAIGGDCEDAEPSIYPGAPCDDGDPYTVNDTYEAWPACGCVGQTISVSAKVMLQGPYSPFTGMMADDLRAQGLIPATEPYTDLGYAAVGTPSPSGAVIDTELFEAEGPDAIVDWIILELRGDEDGAVRIATRYALLQRDGDIVDLDGQGPVRFAAPPANYRLAVLHRNHKGVVLAAGTPVHSATVDFASAATQVAFGASARAPLGPLVGLWQGDVTFNDFVSYTGEGNDREPILVAIGGSVPTSVAFGYRTEDVNMDGEVKYVGQFNDRDPVLQTIGGSVPTNTIPNTYLHTTP